MDQSTSGGATPPPKFPLGNVSVTANAINQIPRPEIMQALARHVRGDWGELDEHDIAVNERALCEEGRLFSRYISTANVKFYIITEWDRSQTTILLPEEY